jgi:hypothetical protein
VAGELFVIVLRVLIEFAGKVSKKLGVVIWGQCLGDRLSIFSLKQGADAIDGTKDYGDANNHGDKDQ